MSCYKLFFLWGLVLPSFGIVSQNSACFDTLTVSILDSDYRSKLDIYLPEKLVIGQLKCISEGKEEYSDLIFYLQLFPGATVKKADLINNLWYVRQLGIYKSVHVDFNLQSSGVYDLVIRCEQHILVGRIKFGGVLRGRQALKSLYVMESGDVFDDQKHRYGVDHMEHFLKEKGYLGAKVNDYVLSGSDQLRHDVRCDISHGKRFLIDDVSVDLSCVGNMADVDIVHLKAFVHDFCIKKLQGRHYTVQIISGVEHKLKNIFLEQGFVGTAITMQPTIFYEKGFVRVNVHIDLEKKREFVFWGNTFFKKHEILQHLMLYGKSTWHFPGTIIADEIQQLYKSKGFLDVRVTIKEEGACIFCSIEEGPAYKINKVTVKTSTQDFRLRQFNKGFIAMLRGKQHDKELIKKSSDWLLKQYKKAGYWDAYVVKQESVAAGSGHTYDYLIDLELGSCFVMGDIVLQDHQDLSAMLVEAYKKYQNKGYDVALLTEQKIWIIQQFKNRGYKKVSAEYQLSHRGQMVDTVWNVILSDDIMKFGRTVFLGGNKVARHKLARECAYQQGQDWDKKLLEDTLHNFQEISVFKGVQVYPGGKNDELEHRPIFIKLTEAERFELKTKFGLQQVGKNLQLKRGFTYKVGGAIKINQLFSQVDDGSFEVDMTRFYRNLSIDYKTPWFGNYKIRSNLKGYDTLYQQPVFAGNQNILYVAKEQGFLWNASYTMGTLRLSGAIGCKFLGLYQADQPDLDLILNYKKSLLGVKTGYIFLEPACMWRSVDSQLNPSSGFSSLISCKMMFDFNNITSFCKLHAEHTQYIPVTSKATCAIRVRAGHIFYRDFDQIHPVERFYLGGPSSIRGYDRDMCPPFGNLTIPVYDPHAGLPSCAHDMWRYAAQGGKTMFNINAELRYKVYKNFSTVLFSDWGALLQSSIQDHQSQKHRNFGGSGIGFRYDTPIGPIRFDVGIKWRISQPDFESRHTLTLSLGHAF